MSRFYKWVDRGWNKLRKQINGAQDAYVKVGVMQSAGRHDSGIQMVELAAIHEYGSPKNNIPERSFLRSTFRDRAAVLAQGKRFASLVVHNRATVPQALEMLGLWAVAEVKKKITTGPSIPPPLKPSTIAKKKSSRALVDTGQLLQSIQHEVVWKGGGSLPPGAKYDSAGRLRDAQGRYI